MGKSKKSGKPQTLGSIIIKDRFAKKKPHRSADSFLHTSELNDGYEWGRLQNLQSITEQNQLDDFLATAELAGTEFTAEKLNIEIVNGPVAAPGILSESELLKISEAQEQNKQRLRIPRRPNWHAGMSPEELQTLERSEFLEWRRSLAELQELENLTITPFERNLDFWRQLWRVIERSDIVVQIVDSRNPLLFRCEDLEAYVTEVDPSKVNVILVNKSDFLTEHQRQCWCDYFSKEEKNIHVLFWSAKLESEKQEAEEEASDQDDLENCAVSSEDTESTQVMTDTTRVDGNTPTLYNATGLVDRLKSLRPSKLLLGDVLTIGLVGYPNVGKSSSINAILQAKKCPVSANPGKTKHFQTVYIDSSTMLCDCPGLVMPSFVNTKADMILNGILPIDHMRDHKAPTNALAHRIARRCLESTYGITIRKPKEGEDPSRPPTDLELLNAYGAMRGFMTASGVPDCPRSARVLLKDYVNGKLLYCEPPPGTAVGSFAAAVVAEDIDSLSTDPQLERVSDSVADIDLQVDSSASRRLDSDFFNQTSSTVHLKGKRAGAEGKLSKKHSNRHKKDKVRRLYSHLDKHDNY